MSVRTKVLGLVDVMMRVPPLIVIDEILKSGMGLSSSYVRRGLEAAAEAAATEAPSTVLSYDDLLTNATIATPSEMAMPTEESTTLLSTMLTSSFLLNSSATISSTFAAYDAEYYRVLSWTTLKFLGCLLGCVASFIVFLLWTRHLVIVYMFLTTVGLIFVSYWSNVEALSLIENGPCLLEDVLSLNMTNLLDPGGVAASILPHLLAQWIMGVLFAYIHLGPRNTLIQKLLPLSFLMPLLLATLPLPNEFLKHTPAFASLLPLIVTKISLWNNAHEIGRTLVNGYYYAKNFAADFGLSALVENEWQRLNVPCVLRAFWTLRILEQLVKIFAYTNGPITFLASVQKLLVTGCETLTAVLGMTSVISIICHYIGKLFQFFLLSEDYDEDKSIGTVSAILFYILALQTGLTSLSPEKRFIRLCRNLCLLVTALLHFLHNIVSPILMSLSAARNPSRKRHARALIVCAFLLIAPITLLTILWSRHSPSTWLLAVTAFSVEVIVKVLVSLATYTLFLLDARRQTFWEKLDDYVYYIRAFGNSVEFCFGIFLFFNGAWILAFESGGAIRALMMGIHAYFNIWCEARAGWTVFMKRRTAVHKISSLPEATPAQLSSFDDVCAICYQEMSSAKITRCRHFFHGVCLRKWLYVQDRCPLCHEVMMYQKNESQPASPTAPPPPPPAETPGTNFPDSPLSTTSSSTNMSSSTTSTEESSALLHLPSPSSTS